ncbi:MAG TPA: hypothetical protein VF092_21370 [Longimicrobium sp.]
MRSGKRVSHRLRRGLALVAAAAAPAAAAAQVPCTPPPAVPPSYFTAANGQPWSQVTRFLIDYGVMFPVGDARPVVPCRGQGCGPADMTIWAAKGVNCLTKAMAEQDSLRILGLVTWSTGAKPASIGFGTRNANQQVYLMVKGDTGIALFQTPGGRTRVIYESVTAGWQFTYEEHPDSTVRPPAAQWRQTFLATGAMRPGGAAASGGGPGVVWDVERLLQTGLSYAWMACASGCCQFQGTGDGGPVGNPPPPGQIPGPPHGPPPGPPPGPPHPSRR